jgi:hypothetical protein
LHDEALPPHEVDASHAVAASGVVPSRNETARASMTVAMDLFAKFEVLMR